MTQLAVYPCLTQVHRKIKSTVTQLISEIPGIQIGIIAHGDYCDRCSSSGNKKVTAYSLY
ncbi:hypothetical protein [Okeania sp.]|uniref:hypothetical protein n=1 Tax=Okeania sp. TaxID=3100323 RepID=UPI002B4ABE9B|nr:hypothetical protein [Okeania sp.]MEB3339999.1 hypothetical protein [Okeania sp.]